MRPRFVQLCILASVCCIMAAKAGAGEPLNSHASSSPGGALASEKAKPASIGPFGLPNADSSSWLRFQFAGQLRLDFQNLDEGRDESMSHDLIMRARRIRPIIGVNLPRQLLSFRLHLSAAPGSLELMDIYFDYKVLRQLQFRCGQYKVPFTRYRIQSFQRLTFVDWPIVTTAFGAERQMGLALHNGYEKPPKYGYALGVFSGLNARASHAVYLPKEVYGEKPLNPSDLADPGPRAKFHPELFLHLAYNARGIQVQSDTDEERNGLRYAIMLSAAWDLDPTPHQDFQLRVAPELLTKYRGLSFCTIGYAGFVEMGEPARTELAMLGGLLQTAYRINDRYEISARCAVVDLQDALVDDAYAAACQSAVATHELQSSLIDPTSAAVYSSLSPAYCEDAPNVLREDEIGIGFNTYIMGHTLKWQNDASWLRHQRRDEDRTDYVVRSQFQLVF